MLFLPELRVLTICLLAALGVAGPDRIEAAQVQPDQPPIRPDQFNAAPGPRIEFDPAPPMGEAEAAGLPRDSHPEALIWERVYRLALARSRSAPKSSFSESLDPKALDEQARRLGLADFALFRQDFLGRPRGAERPGEAFRDPAASFFDVLRRRQAVDTARRTVVASEQLLKVMISLVRGEASSLAQIDVDRCDNALQHARNRFAAELTGYRDRLDEFKIELGLSPHAPVVPDRKSLSAFRDTFVELHTWYTNPGRRLDDLPRLAGQLPQVEDVVLEFVAGHPVLGRAESPDHLESVLLAAEQFAVKGRDRKESEVDLRLRIRRRVRGLLDDARAYELAKPTLILALRMKDQAFGQLLAPAGNGRQASAMVKDLLASDGQLAEAEDRLVALWISCQTGRLALYRELGTFPFNDWSAFYAQFEAPRGDGGHDERPVHGLQPARRPAAPPPPAAPAVAPAAPPAPPPAPPAPK